MKSATTIAAALILSSLVAVPAEAFRYEKYLGHPIKRKTGNIGFTGGQNSYPAGSQRRTMFLLAQERWNQTPGEFDFTGASWGDTKVKRYNGDSETWFTTDQGILKGRPAVCTSVNVYTIPAKIVEADIFYDNDVSWTYSQARSESNVYGGPRRTYLTATVHELGHAFGLQHVNSVYNIMGSDSTHVGSNLNGYWAYAGEDGIEGQVFLYGEDSGAGEDLSVGHFKFGGAAGEYSAHVTTQIFPTGSDKPVAIDANLLAGQPVFRVSAGKSYDVEFTYENNGVHDQSLVDVAFYLSSDSAISTLDRKIGSLQLGTIGRNLPGTWRRRVDIPADAQKKVQYLGVIVDSNDEIAEVVEQNNATFLQIRVVN